MKKIITILLLLVICVCFTACNLNTGNTDTTHTVIDLMGRSVKVPNEAKRIAAIAGPTYEMVYMLGSADNVVMVKAGHTTNYPLALLTYPRLSTLSGLAANPSSSVNIEDYLSKDIDLVVYYDNETELKKFDAVDMAAVVVSKNTGLLDTLEEVQAQTIDDFIANLTNPVRILSEVLNTEEAKSEYKAWAEYCDEKLHMVYDLTKNLAANERKTVYWGNTWGENIRSTYALKNRYYEIQLAGGRLLGPTENSNFPEITAEQLIDWDPDIILVDNHGGSPELVEAGLKKSSSPFSKMTAVTQDNLHRIPSGVFFIDKGTTTTLLVMWLATVIHPELTSSINMVDEVKYYYHEFYEYDLTDEQAQHVIDGWSNN